MAVGDVTQMVLDTGLSQSELKLLVKTQTAFELVAVPRRDGTTMVWTMDVVLGNGDKVMVSKARHKTEHRVWKELSALHRFVKSTIPEVERFTVLTAPLDRKGTDNANKKTGAAR